MKKLVTMLFAATLAITAVQAQENGKERKNRTPEEKAQMMTSRMQKNLSLTDGQVAKVNEINLVQARKMADMRERHGDNKEAAKAEMKAIKTETYKQYASVLSKEQLAKNEQLKKERKEKIRGKKGEHKGKGHHDKTLKK